MLGHGLRSMGKGAPPQKPRIIPLRSITSRSSRPLLPPLAIAASLRVPFSHYGGEKLRFAVVSCPLAPQASHASSSVLRQFQALRSKFSSPLGGSHPSASVQRLKCKTLLPSSFSKSRASALFVTMPKPRKVGQLSRHPAKCLHPRFIPCANTSNFIAQSMARAVGLCLSLVPRRFRKSQQISPLYFRKVIIMKEYPQPNKVGMYSRETAEQLKYENGATWASIHILEIGENKFSYGLHVSIHNTGYSFGIGHKDNTSTSREAVLEMAIKDIETFVKPLGQTAEVAQLLKWAHSHKQMRLF